MNFFFKISAAYTDVSPIEPGIHYLAS